MRKRGIGTVRALLYILLSVALATALILTDWYAAGQLHRAHERIALVVTPISGITTGMRIRSNDIELSLMWISDTLHPLGNPSEVIGFYGRRFLQSGEPLTASDITANAVIVDKSHFAIIPVSVRTAYTRHIRAGSLVSFVNDSLKEVPTVLTSAPKKIHRGTRSGFSRGFRIVSMATDDGADSVNTTLLIAIDSTQCADALRLASGSWRPVLVVNQ